MRLCLPNIITRSRIQRSFDEHASIVRKFLRRWFPCRFKDLASTILPTVIPAALDLPLPTRSAMKTSTIIYNPMSGRPGRRAENVRAMQRLLDAREINSEAQATSAPGDATRLASEAVAANVDLVIAYGGDGTVNETIQGMAGSHIPLAIWPGGTSNVVAKDLRLPFDNQRLAEVFAAGRTNRIALGKALSGNAETERRADVPTRTQESGFSSSTAARLTETLAPSPRPRVAVSRYFLMMAGIGLDASIARGANRRLKRSTGEFAYWVSGIKHLATWKPDIFSLEIDGRVFESAFTLIGNGKGYGGGMMMTPNALLEEPEFEIYILPPLANNLSYTRALMACMRGKPGVAGAVLVKGKHVAANSSREPWVEVDGEIIGPLPMTFEAVPDALTLVVP